MKSISADMAQFAHDLRYADIPPDAIWEGKRFLLDSLGCALAAVKNEDMQAMYRYIDRLGGQPESTVIGRSSKTNCANAALMNCLLTRALDYNDIYWEQDPSHPSDMIGVALACAEAFNKNGSECLTAIIIAYELEMRLCNAAHPGVREVGWHHATLTQFASPFVAGKCIGLSLDEFIAAVGISGSSHFTLGGVVAGHLTNMKNMADPMAAQAGVHAALMAKEDISGPVEVFEGKEALFQVVNNVKWHAEEITKGLGQEYLITRCSYKAFPTEALTHQPISAAIQVCEENNLAPEKIRSILVETTTRGADILSDPSKYHPETKETADHSLPYVIAAAVVDRNVYPDSFSEEKLFDPRIRDLLKKIKVVADPEIDNLFPQVKRAKVHITNLDGATYSAQVDAAKGSPENPMSDDEVIAKFRANSRIILPYERQNRIIEATMQFEKIDKLQEFMQLLVE